MQQGKTVTCDRCNKCCLRKNISRHRKICTGLPVVTSEKQRPCELCGILVTLSNRARHLKRCAVRVLKHANNSSASETPTKNVKMKTCEKCNKCISRKNFDRHLKICPGEPVRLAEPQAPCEFCGTMSTRSHMSRHLVTCKVKRAMDVLAPKTHEEHTQNGSCAKIKHPDDVQLFVCYECNRPFKQKEDLQRHLLLHTNDPHSTRYICAHCSEPYGCLLDLGRHIKARHTSESGDNNNVKDSMESKDNFPFKNGNDFVQEIDRGVHNSFTKELVPVCGAQSNLDNQKQELKIETKFEEASHGSILKLGGSKIKLPECDEGFIPTHPIDGGQLDETSLNQSEVCESSTDEQINNTFCDQVGIERNMINRNVLSCSKCHEAKCICQPGHITNVTSSNTESNCECYKCRRQQMVKKNTMRYKCENCGRSFKEKDRLEIHKRTNCNFLKAFICSICVKGFGSPKALTHHNFAFHIKEPGDHQCSTCEKIFSNHYLLKVHKCKKNTSPTLSEIPRVPCELCGKTFINKDSLTNHMLYYHSAKKYFCTHCKAGFTDKSVLATHIQSKHSSETFRCEICEVNYKTMIGLKFHMKKHNVNNKFICETCGKEFITKERLQLHIATHSDEKPWVCEQCGKSFRTTSNLQQHSVTHSEKRPYVCDVCGSGFRIRNHLRQHMAVHGMVNTSTKRKRRY